MFTLILNYTLRCHWLLDFLFEFTRIPTISSNILVHLPNKLSSSILLSTNCKAVNNVTVVYIQMYFIVIRGLTVIVFHLLLYLIALRSLSL